MVLETKFSIGSYCYFVEENSIRKAEIISIEIRVVKNSFNISTPEIFYNVKMCEKIAEERGFSEEEICTTIDELLEALKEKYYNE